MNYTDVINAIETMTTEAMVERFKLHIDNEGRLATFGCYLPGDTKAIKSRAWAKIKAREDEIKTYIKDKEAAEQAAWEDRKRRIAAIPGLTEIKAANADLAAWHREFMKSFDSEDGGGFGVRPKPEYDMDAMRAKYPIAVAYLKAEKESESYNYDLKAIGEKALERIIYHPEEYKEALAEMEDEKAAFAERHMWD